MCTHTHTHTHNLSSFDNKKVCLVDFMVSHPVKQHQGVDRVLQGVSRLSLGADPNSAYDPTGKPKNHTGTRARSFRPNTAPVQ